MKQGNSESDQTPDFVGLCFRKVVYSKGSPPEFRMFSTQFGFLRGKNRIFDKKNSDFRYKKNRIFEKKIGSSKKSRIFEKKNRDFVFPAMSHNFFFFEK